MRVQCHLTALLCWLFVECFLLWLPASSLAGVLGIPSQNATLSGIGVISGWKCQAGELTVRFNGGSPVPLLYGARRLDVLRAGACDHDRVGFLTIWNWGDLGDGTHTAVVYDNGVEFASSQFRVVTTGYAFLEGRGATCLAEDFPFPGDQSTFVWDQATQGMELFSVREWYDEVDTPSHPASADLDFLLSRDTWTIEVPDILAWQSVSQWEHPEYNGGFDNPASTWRGGNRYVAGPADVDFIRYIRGGTSNKLYPDIPPPGILITGIIQGTRVSHTDRYGNVILKPALRKLIEVGTLANGLPLQTSEAIGELGEGYSMVVPMSTPDTTQSNRCFILVFDNFRRTAEGGIETQARFYRTARTPYQRGEPRWCVPPIYPGGINGRGYPRQTREPDVTRVLIY